MTRDEVDVLSTIDSGQGREFALEGEVRALKRQLAQREQALVSLNRRLLELERGDLAEFGGSTDVSEISAWCRKLRDENQELREELSRVYNTKLFRWASPLRRVYSLVRAQQ